jgi:alanine dehydrogenase
MTTFNFGSEEDNMPEVMILSQEDIASVLDMKSVIEAVRQAYAYKCSGEAQLFPLVCHSFEDGKAEMDIKSGTVDGAGIFGLKLVSWFSGNVRLGIPALTGTIVIFDRETGKLKSVMDGTRITCMRTGAAGAVGARYLARHDSENLLMIGAGTQAINLIMATLEVMEGIQKVTIHDPMSFEQARRFAAGLKDKMVNEYVSHYRGTPHYDLMSGRMDIEYTVSENLERACRQADIILTATPSRKALVKTEWVMPGTHLSCIGADMEGKQEIEENLLGMARVFADDTSQVIAVGECEKAHKGGILKKGDIAEIGDVIRGVIPGRRSRNEITLFDSTGIGIQDLMTAEVAARLACQKGQHRLVAI